MNVNSVKWKNSGRQRNVDWSTNESWYVRSFLVEDILKILTRGDLFYRLPERFGRKDPFVRSVKE